MIRTKSLGRGIKGCRAVGGKGRGGAYEDGQGEISCGGDVWGGNQYLMDLFLGEDLWRENNEERIAIFNPGEEKNPFR